MNKYELITLSARYHVTLRQTSPARARALEYKITLYQISWTIANSVIVF